jgi:Zn-dependent peptidase ImmA (M78 family)/transcriptional regulator with XRE-family HTH domain
MNKTKLVYGERIREAREIKGFSQTTLSELVGVQRQTISAYEKNLINPSTEILFAIVSVTQFPITFFLNDRPRGDGKRTTPISFRKRESSTKMARLQAEQYENLFADIYYYLKQYINFFPPNIPFLGKTDYQTIKDSEIEDIATEVRRSWGLKDGPIPHLMRLLENNGILIAPVKLAITMDAFSTWHHDRPIIMLSDIGRSCFRRRFNEAHELGHLVLHASVDEEDFSNTEMRKKMDQQAHRFAGAFLFPATSVYHEFFSCSITALKKLKERWKLSIAALAMRLHDLHIINDNQKSYIMIQIGQNRKKEPLDDTLPIEEPTIIKKAVELLIENKVLSLIQVIEDLYMPEPIFSMLTTIELPKPTEYNETIIPFSMRNRQDCFSIEKRQ